MANPFSRPDEMGRSFEQGISSATSQVKNAAKTVVKDVTDQTSKDWIEALYGRSDASPSEHKAAQPSPAQGELPPDPFTQAETKAIVADEQRGDKGVEALNPQQQKQKHAQHHKTTYYEPLFGEERKKKLKQQEEQEEQVEEQEEQNERWQLEEKKKKQNNEIVKAQTKRETGVGNAGG